MSDLDYLIDILEASVERHGEKPLTNHWMLNIVKMAQRKRGANIPHSWDWLTMDDIC